MEFIPSANAWKVCGREPESESSSTVHGFTRALDFTPLHIQEALERKMRIKNDWKEAIIEFRAIMRKSDVCYGSPSPPFER